MYLVDTSVWVHALRRAGNAAVGDLLKPIIVAGDAAITEWIVLELMTGLRGKERKESLLELLSPLRYLSLDSGGWQTSWENAVSLRRHGITPTAADCLIATVALVHGVELIHCDSDFEAMKRVLSLETVDWTAVAGS